MWETGITACRTRLTIELDRKWTEAHLKAGIFFFSGVLSPERTKVKQRGNMLCKLLLSSRSNPAEMKQQWGESGSALSFSYSFYVQTKKKSNSFLYRDFLSEEADVWGDAGSPVFVRRTPGYAWWHPGWARASKGQRYKLFSLKFCIGVGSDGSTRGINSCSTQSYALTKNAPLEMQMNDLTGETVNSLMLTETFRLKIEVMHKRGSSRLNLSVQVLTLVYKM